MYNEKTTQVEVGGKTMTYKVGKFAPRSEMTVWAQMGETVVMTFVSMSEKDANIGYFPLSIEYIEKHYAGGMISGSRFIKRELRPSDEAVLKARQIDHSIRSLFPKGFMKPVNVIVTVMAYDGENDPELLAVNSASLGLMLSSIPFDGPSASVRLTVKKDGQINVNDHIGLNDEHDFDGEFTVSVREGRVLNIEGAGTEIPEELMGQVLDKAVESCEPILQMQRDFAVENGKTKREFAVDADAVDFNEIVANEFSDKVSEGLYTAEDRNKVFASIVEEISSRDEDYNESDINDAVEYVAKKIMRKNILEQEKRTSGRRMDEIRDLDIEVGLMPRVHGSALFGRGKTQCMAILTLGSTRLAQIKDGFQGETTKSFMVHYNGPNYSFGQAGRFNYYPGRREVGHGHISESAFALMVPDTSEFPYTVRVVGEVMSQNGSSSMATACATSLALMDAGVPLKKQIGAIAIGLVTADDDLTNYKLITDMEDVEDFYGDMDFKVTGTVDGVTSIQLDNKLKGVPVEILKEAFVASKTARLQIIEAMNNVISEPRESLSKYAPRVQSVMIPQDKIGELIGPGGKNIKAILEEGGEGLDIDIQDDGQVNISAVDGKQIEFALSKIEAITEEPEVGKIYTAKVDKIMNYGAFVNISANITGLVHISEIVEGFLKDPNDVISEGQSVQVKLKSIENGKQSFTMKGLNPDIKSKQA